MLTAVQKTYPACAWGNDADEQRRTPIICYWKISFPLQLLPDIVTWTTASFPAAGCAKATEDEILAVFGILYALTRTSERKRDFHGRCMVFSQHRDLVKDIPFHATALRSYLDVYYSELILQWRV